MINIVNTKAELTTALTETITFSGNCIKNRIWYRGDPSEIEQFFKQTQTDNVSKARFWAATPTHGHIRKFHTGIFATVVDSITELIMSDMQSVEIKDQTVMDRWVDIASDNQWDSNLLSDAITETLTVGDGVFKISYDADISKLPIIEFVSGEDLEIITKRNRPQEYRFSSYYDKNNDKYKLVESYKRGSIEYKLYDKADKEVPLSTIDELGGYTDVYWKEDYFLCVPLKFYKSPKWKERGMSILERKSDNIDALDEIVSQWIEAIRDGKVKNYIPESLLPKNAKGEVVRGNPFDNKFIQTETSMREGAQDTIEQKQADINYNAFVESYASMLDLVLQGIVSPSTLGIDLKKTDNAESQREKEKTTMKTRGKIVDVLTEVIPVVIVTALRCQDGINKMSREYDDITVVFGEYASPSFEDKLNIINQASAANTMSIERQVEELWGDSLTDEEKAEEVQRLKELRGVIVAEEEPDDIHNFGEDKIDDEEEETELE